MKKNIKHRGDDGATGLLDGRRIDKTDVRTEALGSLDEVHAFIGLARAKGDSAETCAILLTIQNHLHVINAELACPTDSLRLLKWRLTSDDMQQIEEALNNLREKLHLPARFVLYGANEVSALIDVARAIVRRAERRVISLHQQHPLENATIIPYLNRLSDLLFMLARGEEHRQNTPALHPQV